MPDAALHFAEALLPQGWAANVRIEIADGLIATIAGNAPPQPQDERHAIALPGLSNLHSHAFQRGMAGLAERSGPAADSFWSWRQVMYRFLAALTPEDVEAIAALAYAEMLEAGFTRVGEFHYLHHAADGAPYDDAAEMATRIAAAATTTGIALTLLPVFYAHGNFGAAPPAEGQRRFVTTRDQFARLAEASAAALAALPDSAIGIAPHSLRAVTPEELAHCIELAAGRPLHMHIAEQTREVEDCLAWSGARPVEYLLQNAPVGPEWCLVHATHMTGSESTGLARSGTVAGLCPVTEANLGDGIFDAPAWLREGGRYGVGTDSNILIDAAAELRQLEYSQRLAARQRNVIAQGGSTGRALFQSALEGGAAALGANAGLRAGAPADIVALDGNHPSLAQRRGDLLLDGWIFAASRAVRTVWRRGRVVVRDGTHVDRPRIEQAWHVTIARLMQDVP